MQNLLNYIIEYGYIILFLYSLGGGMIAILAAGIACANGSFNIGICITIAAIANFLGDEILFYLAKYNGNELLPYLKKYKRQLAIAKIMFKKNGIKIIFIKKYIYGFKTIIPIIIAITKYNDVKFLLANLISAIIWSLSLGLMSYFAGDFVLKISEKFGENISIYIALFILIILVFFLKRKSSKRS